MADKYTNLTALTEFLSNIKTWALATFSSKFSILSYGNSTWDDFIAAYTSKTVVYCRASSNSNPASGSQTRLAFMAYVNNAENPTEVEFQYYRSVSTHSDNQQGDQVFVYKLNKTGGWTVTTRQTFTKVDTEKGLTDNWSNGVITLKPKLKSETQSSLTAADKGSTTDREYAVGLDASGNLAVNVPWTDTTYDPATTSADGLMSSTDKTKLNGIATGATAVDETTVSSWGFTKNAGTITGITMNGASKGTSGNVDLGTVITAHQDISGKQDKITPITAQTTQALYPIKIDSQGHITSYGSAQTIPAAVRVKGNAESTYRTGDVNLTPANIGAAVSSHTHGNIQNGGTLQTSDVAIANGDKLVVTDASDSSKVARTSLAFDGSTTNEFLSKAGTFESVSGGITALDVYPVGSIYMSVNSTSPATLFGGTWEQLEDRFLLGAGSTYTAGDTGGEATHLLDTNEIPSHSHYVMHRAWSWSGSGGSYLGMTDSGGHSGFNTGNTGGGQAHNNMPPYLVVYMWKRKA